MAIRVRAGLDVGSWGAVVSTPVAPVRAVRAARPGRRRWRPFNRWVGVLLAVLVLAVTAIGVVVTMIGASLSVSGSCCLAGTPDDGAIVNTTAVQGFLLAGGLLAATGVAVAAWLLLVPRWVNVALAVTALVLVPLWTARLAAVDWRGCPTGDTTGFVPPCGTATVALHRPASPVTLDPGQTVHQHLYVLSRGPFTLAITPGADQVSVRMVDLHPDPTGHSPRPVTTQPSPSGTLIQVPDGAPSLWDITLTSRSATPVTATIELHLIGPDRDQ